MSKAITGWGRGILGLLCLAAGMVRAADATGETLEQPLETLPVYEMPIAPEDAPRAAEQEAPAGAFMVLPGFVVERVFSVPREELGSWVCLARDGQGRLIASDQADKGLCRITPAPLDASAPTVVERLETPISSAQGMLWAFDSLYVVVNKARESGLYRLRDTDGDDQFDEVVKLRSFRGDGEHGPHAVRLAPDGKRLYVVCGNHTRPPIEPGDKNANEQLSSAIPTNWGEDLLLPRQWDARGHAVGIMAPGGWIAELDPEGKACRLISIGYRNAYDIAFNSDGELFAYDADMEWDMGMPWYRPTRIVHATGGSEFGWRSGTGKWPEYYIDSLPSAVDLGPGSPVGITFGYGSNFPEKYQRALYACDWTFGTIYAVHLEPEGASYRATKEEFLSSTPLPLTSAVIGADGALYFTTGGRGLESGLFRVRYAGSENTEAREVDSAKAARAAELRTLRRQIESRQHAADDPSAAVEFLLPFLKHEDRFIRYAARVALEFQPAAAWQDRIIGKGAGANDPQTLIEAAVALARQGDQQIQPQLLAALSGLDCSALSTELQLGLLRAYQLVLIRMGTPQEQDRLRLTKALDAVYPAEDDRLNRELCNLLVYLESPTVVAKTMKLIGQTRPAAERLEIEQLIARGAKNYYGPIAEMLAHQPDEQKLHYALALRNAKTGWSLQTRRQYFEFLQNARRWRGGASFEGFLDNIDRQAFENASEEERLAIEAAGIRRPNVPPELPKPRGPGRERTLAQVLELAENGLVRRSFAGGKKAFAAARCVVCHRFAGEGGATGPDLSQLAGRFSAKSLIEAIVEPSKVVSDRYRESIYIANGVMHKGVVIGETDESVTLLTDPEVATKTVVIQKKDLDDEPTFSTVSIMPADLLRPLNDQEVLDLLAYLLSRGDERHPMFRRR